MAVVIAAARDEDRHVERVEIGAHEAIRRRFAGAGRDCWAVGGTFGELDLGWSSGREP